MFCGRQLRAFQRKFGRNVNASLWHMFCWCQRPCQRKFEITCQRQLRAYNLYSVDASFGHVNESLRQHVNASLGHIIMFCGRQLRACQRKFGRNVNASLWHMFCWCQRPCQRKFAITCQRQLRAYNLCSVDASFGHVNESLGEHVNASLGHIIYVLLMSASGMSTPVWKNTNHD